jgi:hypothetical protein
VTLRWSGFSMGGGEVARYIGRYGSDRVAKGCARRRRRRRTSTRATITPRAG